MTEAQRKVLDTLWEIHWRFETVQNDISNAPRADFSHVFEVKIDDCDNAVQRLIQDMGKL